MPPSRAARIRASRHSCQDSIPSRRRSWCGSRRTRRTSACRCCAPRMARSKACCSTSPGRSNTSSRPTRVNSKHYNLKVVDLPYVQRLELEYHFPAYTGPCAAESRGRRRHRRAEGDRGQGAGRADDERARRTDRARRQGAIGPRRRMPPVDRRRRSLGAFKVDKDGFYHIELDAPSGERMTASPQYTIDALDDQPPTVSISKPGRDTTGVTDRRSVRRGTRRGRLRRQGSRSRVLRQRRRGEDHSTVRRARSG